MQEISYLSSCIRVLRGRASITESTAPKELVNWRDSRNRSDGFIWDDPTWARENRTFPWAQEGWCLSIAGGDFRGRGCSPHPTDATIWTPTRAAGALVGADRPASRGPQVQFLVPFRNAVSLFYRRSCGRFDSATSAARTLDSWYLEARQPTIPYPSQGRI
jgi:hypothetical protein